MAQRDGLQDLWQFAGCFREPLPNSNGNTFELRYTHNNPAVAAALRTIPPSCVDQAYHGTKSYNMWKISLEGIRASCDESLGHDFHHAGGGVYVGPTLADSNQECYATPQDMFGTGIYCSFIFTVAVDRRGITAKRKHEWLVREGDAHVIELKIMVNPRIGQGASRLQGFEPWLEALPDGCTTMPNSITGPRLANPWGEWGNES